MIKLGDKIRDTITGLEGIAVCRSVWLWGCVRIGLQPNEIKDGKPVEETWLDENRLEIVREEKEKKIKAPEKLPKSPYSRGHGGPGRESKKIIEG